MEPTNPQPADGMPQPLDTQLILTGGLYIAAAGIFFTLFQALFGGSLGMMGWFAAAGLMCIVYPLVYWLVARRIVAAEFAVPVFRMFTYIILISIAGGLISTAVNLIYQITFPEHIASQLLQARESMIEMMEKSGAAQTDIEQYLQQLDDQISMVRSGEIEVLNAVGAGLGLHALFGALWGVVFGMAYRPK